MEITRQINESIERAKLGLIQLENEAQRYPEIYSLGKKLLNVDQFIYGFSKTKKLKPSYKELVSQDPYSHFGDMHETIWAGEYIPEPVYEFLHPEVKRRMAPCNRNDKVLQTTLHTGLGRIYAPEFSEYSYAYQCGKNIDLCINNLKHSFANSKNIYAVKLDISNYFGTVPHSPTIDFLSNRIKDKKFLTLIRRILETEVIHRKSRTPRGTGIIQGSVIGPVLSNVFLHHVFDLWYSRLISKYKLNSFFARYADDIIMFFSSRAEAESYLQNCYYRFREYGLKIHPRKSKIIDISKQEANFVGYSLFYKDGLQVRKIKKEEIM